MDKDDIARVNASLIHTLSFYPSQNILRWIYSFPIETK